MKNCYVHELLEAEKVYNLKTSMLWQFFFSNALAIFSNAMSTNSSLSIAFYDALIIASAQTAGCNVRFSEELNTGEVIAGVRLLDPFVMKV